MPIKLFIPLIILVFASSCTYKNDGVIPDESGFPPEISEIMINKCATAGCHNNISSSTAGGLSLETWDKMFEGTNNGAVVIPYRPDFSTLMFFVNTDSANGTLLIPTMPYNAPPLSQSEYTTLKEWIQNGAPDKNGFVKFSDNQSKQKLYITNQGADVVAVFDAEKSIAMRYIDVGNASTIEVPHLVKISPDNQYWYAVLYIGTVLQKFRTSDNSLVGEANIGTGYWNTMSISADSKTAFVSDMSANGKVVSVNLESMNVVNNPFATALDYPHGTALNKNDDTLYVTAQTGNFIYKIPVDNPAGAERILVDPTAPGFSTVSSNDPHEILFNDDYSRYYVTCQQSNDVRVFLTSNDSLLAIIPTSEYPVEMAMSSTKQYLFVTCMNAVNAGISIIGRVDVIDMNANTIMKSIVTGHQPHGIAVSDQYKKVFVGNRNSSHGGPQPHHGSALGRNGYITAIDLNTLDLITGFKSEVSVDPYSLSITR